MPSYEYECISCNVRYETVQPIGENVAPLCCGVVMRQVYSVPGVSFKGTGSPPDLMLCTWSTVSASWPQ